MKLGTYGKHQPERAPPAVDTCSGLHSKRAGIALHGPGRPTLAATITPRGTGLCAPETAIRTYGREAAMRPNKPF